MRERRQPRPDGLGVGQLPAQLKRQLAQHALGLVNQMLAARQDRAALAVPQRQQLVQFIGPAVLPGALERPGQQRVRERLPRDPLGVERVGLPALARPVRPRCAVRAHIPHIMATSDQKHRGVPAPAGRALDAPAGDRPELPRPRLERSVPITRHPEVPAGDGPAARIHNHRGQRPRAGRPQPHCPRDRASAARSTDPDPCSCRPSAKTSNICCDGAGRQRPSRDRSAVRSTLLSGQTGSRRHRPRSTLHPKDTNGSRPMTGQTPVRSSTLTRTAARAGNRHFNTGTY
jgi:hypothetical protein